jgi:hypothetical protein
LTATDRAVELVEIAATAASDKLATDIIAYDVSEQLVITDAFVPRSVCSTPLSDCGRTARRFSCRRRSTLRPPRLAGAGAERPHRGPRRSRARAGRGQGRV